MFAIYKRELKACFDSFVGFLFVGVTLFFPGLYFTVYGLLQGYPYYYAVVSSVSFLFLISVPILTMRVLAEERKNKTDQLILTLPISTGGVVMGKFLAMETVFAIPTAITCLFPLILAHYGNTPMAENYLAILAFFLYGTASIALGILVSSLTESQVIAAVLSFAFLFLGYMMSSILSLITSSNPVIVFLTRILASFDMYSPFYNLLNGTLQLDAVIYFLSLTALFLFLTVQSIQKRRYSVSVKHLAMGAYSGISVAVLIAVVVVLNMALAEMPSTWTSIDVTSQKLYSLTDQTKEYLDTLDEDVTIYVMVNEDNRDMLLGETLQRYDDLSEHITVEYVDPAVNPLFHTQYTNQSISMNSLIVVSDKRSKVIDASDLYESTYDYTYYTEEITGYDGEGQITSALAYVTTEDVPKMYLTEGHGEYGLDVSYTAALEKENVEYETINLMDLDAVPEDAACLLINGPLKDFNEDDRDKVLDYLQRGGKVIAVASVTEENMEHFQEILDYMGLHLANGLVVEENAEYYYQNPYYLLPDIKYSSYTSGIYGAYYAFAPYCQGILIPEDTDEITYQTLLETSEDSFARADVKDISSADRGEGDVDGPFALAVEAVRTLGADDAAEGESVEGGSEDAAEGESGVSESGSSVATMILVSSDQLFTDAASIVPGNQMLFTNIIGSFCAHEVSVSIPSKSYEMSNLMVTQSDIILFAVLLCIVLPLASLGIGLVHWLRRRKL